MKKIIFPFVSQIHLNLDEDLIRYEYSEGSHEELDEGEEYDEDEENSYESIYLSEEISENEEKIHGNYYIGTILNVRRVKANHDTLLDMNVSAKTFFNHTFCEMTKYFNSHSWPRGSSKSIEIMKLDMKKDEYCVIIKTHWIRLVQRTWKRVFIERKRILKQRMSINCQRYFEMRGQYPNYASNIPEIHGMLYGI
jgi:uncharacterized protein YifE (UPF0438 family)